MTKIIADAEGWNSNYSYIQSTKFHNHTRYAGEIYYKNHMYCFSMNENPSVRLGGIVLTGSIRAEDETGKILKHKPTSPKGREILDKYPGLNENSQKFDIKGYLNAKSLEEDEVKKVVLKGAEDLYSKYALEIEKSSRKAVRSDVITLTLAISKFFDRYISSKHPNAGENYKKQILSRMNRLANALPNKAMKQFNRDDIKYKEFSRQDIIELYKFWDFCIAERVCMGNNPVKIPPIEKQDYDRKQSSASRIEFLELDEQDKLYDNIENHITPAGMAAALMLGARLTTNQIAELKVEDFFIRDADENYVIVKLEDESGSSATHNRSKPLLPRAAAIFLKALPIYYANKGKRMLKNMPVVWDIKNPVLPMSKTRIVQEVRRLLEHIVIDPDALAAIYGSYPQVASTQTLLFNSYDHIVDVHMNLQNADGGTASFLKGESLTYNSTNDNYSSFTDVDAQRRIFDIMKCVRKLERIKESEQISNVPSDTTRTITCKPIDSRSQVCFKIVVKLKYGEELRNICNHGGSRRMLVKKSFIDNVPNVCLADNAV